MCIGIENRVTKCRTGIGAFFKNKIQKYTTEAFMFQEICIGIKNKITKWLTGFLDYDMILNNK